MGESPWKRLPKNTLSPEGTTSVAPFGACDSGGFLSTGWHPWLHYVGPSGLFVVFDNGERRQPVLGNIKLTVAKLDFGTPAGIEFC